MKICIESFGCTRRKLEVSKFHRYFALNGYEIITDPKKADYVLVTTCAFKKEEEEYSLALLDRMKAVKARVVVYGCLPAIAPEKYKAKCQFDYVTPEHIDEIDSRFENIRYKFSEIKESNVIPGFIKYSQWPNAFRKFRQEFEFSRRFFDRAVTYAANKIQKNPGVYYLFTSKGCLGDCSYCAIKYAVGRVKSKPVDSLVQQFREGVRDGFKDFIILGDDVGAYGQDINSSFPELLAALVREADNITANVQGNLESRGNGRIHFHIEEIHPNWVLLFRNELLDIISSDKIDTLLCPIQSGNDRILKLMKRGHSSEGVLEILFQIRAANPGIRLSSQIIAGFPSETESDFNDTLQLLKSARFDEVIVFPYDEKENTDAIKINPKVPEQVIRQRVNKALTSLKEEGINAYLNCQ